MKFRYKVLLINMIVLSIGIGTLGFFMIHKNFNLALNSQIKISIEENNLIQSVIEYESLGYDNLSSNLAAVGEKVTSSMYVNETSIYIVYGGKELFSNAETSCPSSLWENAEFGRKNYIIVEEDGRKYIYASSCNEVLGKNLNIINKRDITSVYELMENQKRHYIVLLVIVLFVCSLFMYLISFLLTRPLEKLSKVSESFSKGDYDARAHITSSDEVGELAYTYNNMASAVSNHIEELQNMVTRQEQFVADFTHEIKTPMTSIIGYSDTIRSLNLPREEQIMAASYIFNEGKRLEAMSMKLFEFIYTKHHQVSFEAINTKSLAYAISESVKPAYEKAKISLEITVDSQTVYGDKDLLTSALINLLDNGRKASQKEDKVILKGALQDDSYIFTIQDFGIGISKEHLEKICDEFYMVNKSRSRKEGGAGLGLSLAQQIIKAHNGELLIASTLGEGTTISVVLPLNPPEKKEVD